MVKKKISPIIIITILFAIAIITAATVFFTKNNEGYRTISVIETSGNVVVVKDGIEYRAYSGMMLQEGYEIITSGNSYVRMCLDGDKYIKVESGSKLVFEKLGFLGSGKTKINLERGSMTSELVAPLKENEDYVVNTPNAVLAVRGTFFRVDLKPTESGELVADVITYGGSVATKKIEPNGEISKEEVVVDAGRKVCINMDQEKTSYVVGGVKIEDDSDTQGVVKTEPIKVEDISDEDMIDIYYSVQNGHKLFVTEEEVQEKIKERKIEIEEYVSVYKKAEEVQKKQEGKIVEKEVYADDSKSIAIAPDNNVQGDNQIITGIAPTDGESVHIHLYVESVTKEETCTVDGEKTFACECGDSYTEPIPFTGHTLEMGGTTQCHRKCTKCDVAIEDGTMHVYTEKVTVEPTCTLVGTKTYTCECGHIFTEEIPMIEHIKVMGGTVDCHGKCSVCDAVTEDGAMHVYTETVTKEATHKETGEKAYACECGYSYQVSIPAYEHVKVKGGTEDCHSKCSECGDILEDGVSHIYSETILLEPTCTQEGTKELRCECGYYQIVLVSELGHDYADEYTVDVEPTCTQVGSKSRHCSRCESLSGQTQIPMIAHTEETGGSAECHSKCSVCGKVTQDGTMHSYTESVVTEATCVDVGSKLYACQCGYQYNKEIPALGHNYNEEYTIDIEPTCTKEGSKSRQCSRCDSITDVTEIAAIGHDYQYKTDVATDDKDGREYEKCNNCGDEINEKVIIGVNPINFPDEVVRAYVKDNFDIDGDNGLKQDEIAGAINISIELEGTENITSLKGIEYLTSLEMLSVSDASGVSDGEIDVTNNVALTTIAIPNAAITKLDVSNNKELQMLVLTNTDITELDISANDDLFYLYVDDSELKTLDASDKSNLQYLYASRSKLENINVDNCSSLQNLEISKTNLTSLDASTLTGLHELSCANTDITELDLSSSSLLETLYIEGCDKIVNLDISGTKITSIDNLSGLTMLQTLDISDTGYTEINVQSNTALVTLTARNCQSLVSVNSKINEGNTNALTNVDVSGCTNLKIVNLSRCNNIKTLNTSTLDNLTELDMDYNQNIASLDLSNNAKLQILKLSSAKALDELNISGCSELVDLKVTNSKLASLEVTDCTKLTTLNVTDNASLSVLTISGCTELNTTNMTGNIALDTLTINDCGVTTIANLSECTILTTLDLNNCTVLETLDLYGMSELQYVDISSCTSLEDIDFTGCAGVSTLVMSKASIAELNVSGLVGLLEIYMDNSSGFDTLDVSACSGITSIDMTNCSDIKTFNAEGCSALSSVTFSGCTGLKNIYIGGTAFTTLGINQLTALETINASNCQSLTNFSATGNDNLETVSVSGCGVLTNLNLANCSSLVSIDTLNSTKIEFITITGSEALKTLNLSGLATLQTITATSLTALESLNLSGCTAMIRYDVAGCVSLKTLDLSGCTSLTSIDMSGCSDLTSLITLDVSRNGSLTHLDISTLTALSSIIVANSGNMKYIDISNTQLTGIDTSGMYNVENYICRNATQLISINLSNSATKLKMLDMAGTAQLKGGVNINSFTNLETLDISGWDINSLDLISSLKGTLKTLKVNNTQLTGFSPAEFASLKTLECKNIKMTTFSANNSALEYLDISENALLTQVNVEQTTALKTFIADDCSSLTTVYIWGNALLESISLKNNQVMGHVQPQSNPYLTVLDFTGAVAMISTNTMSLEGSGTSSGSLTIIVTGSPITRSNFTAGWNDSYMTIVN